MADNIIHPRVTDPRGTNSRRCVRELGYVVLCLFAALIVTWPLVTVFTTRICGDIGDPYQSLWGMRWFHDAIVSRRNPFFTDRLFHPFGTTLRLHALDIPSTLLVLPLWGWLPEVAIYNVAVIIALTLAAYGITRLVRELTGDTLVAGAMGVLSLALPYHTAHLRAHLYYISTGWLAFYVMYLLRLLHREPTIRNGVLAGAALALASLASWYYLVFAAIVTLVLCTYQLATDGSAFISKRRVRAVAVLVVTYAVLAGPVLVPMLVASAQEEFVGAHDPTVFSADVYSFVYPNVVQRWGDGANARALKWSGNAAENGNYVGVSLLFLALIGAWSARRARPFLVLALIGAVLSLGPFLHVDGRLTTVRLPYWYLERWLPPLRMTGVPVRLGYLMYLGLILAASSGLARLHAWGGRLGRVAMSVAVLLPVAAAAVEYWPRPVMTSSYSVPPPMRVWASDPTSFAVLDTWDFFRPMWHATIHGKPMVGGYLARTPKRLYEWAYGHPLLPSIMYPDHEISTSRVDATIDFASRGENPGTLPPGVSKITWTGSLVAPAAGTYEFWLSANDLASLTIDDRALAATRGPCRDTSPCEAQGRRELSAGTHRLAAAYVNRFDGAQVHLAWAPPGQTRQIVPASVLRTAGGDAGLDGTYRQHVPPISGLGLVAGRQALRDLSIRYVITRTPNTCLDRELALPLVYADEEVRIYEVPPP